jgi:hypothetical protein
MRTIFRLAMSMTCFAVMASAAPLLLDLSRSHSIETLKRSGIRVNEIAGGLRGQAYLFENLEIEILLPGGRSFKQAVVLGTIDTKDGEITRLYMSGGVMPHDEAIEVMRLFHERFYLPMDSFDAWETRNRGKIRNAEPYSVSTNERFYPRVSLGMDVSMNGLYPWVIGLLISWDWEKQRDWNEERAWREMPPSKDSAISLDPPSGQKHQRREAYKESLNEQAKFEKELAAKGQTRPPSMTSAPPQSPLVVEPMQSKISSIPWVIGAILLIAVAVGVLFKFRRK